MILITGRGTSGSWSIRGVQLGQAIGAQAIPSAVNLNHYKLVVLVKRPRFDMVQRLHAARARIVWDVVDAWPQPLGNDWARPPCIGWIKSQLSELRPHALVAATQAMAVDLDFHTPVLNLPHHARPGQRLNPIREKVKTVGYEGGEGYLGAWRPWFEEECARRGWSFVVNPPHLADVDIVIAVREATGYAVRQWKSNVKLANAQGSKTPCVMMREAGYLETASGGERWADTKEEFIAAFDELTDVSVRRQVAQQLHAPTIDAVADSYKQWLEQL